MMEVAEFFRNFKFQDIRLVAVGWVFSLYTAALINTTSILTQPNLDQVDLFVKGVSFLSLSYIFSIMLTVFGKSVWVVFKNIQAYLYRKISKMNWINPRVKKSLIAENSFNIDEFIALLKLKKSTDPNFPPALREANKKEGKKYHTMSYAYCYLLYKNQGKLIDQLAEMNAEIDFFCALFSLSLYFFITSAFAFAKYWNNSPLIPIFLGCIFSIILLKVISKIGSRQAVRLATYASIALDDEK